MLYFFLYLGTVLLVFLVGIAMFVYALYSVIASLMGAPFVPTKQKEINFILDHLKLKKGQKIIELGSGDGRFIRSAVKKYGVEGWGVDIQPWLIMYSKFMASIQGLSKAHFKTQNFFNTNLSEADVIFLFLMPNTLKKLREKFLKECKKGTLFISHGFIIEDWEKYLVEKIEHKPFPTYFYKI